MTSQQDEQRDPVATEQLATVGVDEFATGTAALEDGFEPDPDDDGVDDDLAFAPTARRGIGRVTGGLLIGIALVAAFGGGVYVQKHNAPAAGTAAGGRAAFARAGGFAGAGAAGGFGGFGGAGVPGATGTGTGTTGTAAAGPAVIGTVVKVTGTTVTVRNFAGRTITVHVPDGTTVTKSTTLTVGDLKQGASVTVTGTTAADGSVTATAVTAR